MRLRVMRQKRNSVISPLRMDEAGNFVVLVWSGRCDSLAGGQPEHAYTDGVGGMAASWRESHRQRLHANTGSKISGG